MVLGEQGFCSKCGNAYLSNNHSINCLSSQTPFTDDDLKRLKEDIRLSTTVIDSVDLQALLARLEAAEKTCIDLGHIIVHCNHKPEGWDRCEKSFKAWRKTKGEK